jgi:hypothetical protein
MSSKNDKLRESMNEESIKQRTQMWAALADYRPSEATYDPTDRSPLYLMECEWESVYYKRKEAKRVNALFVNNKLLGPLNFLMKTYYKDGIGESSDNIDADGVNLYDKYKNFDSFCNHKYLNIPDCDDQYHGCILPLPDGHTSLLDELFIDEDDIKLDMGFSASCDVKDHSKQKK